MFPRKGSPTLRRAVLLVYSFAVIFFLSLLAIDSGWRPGDLSIELLDWPLILVALVLGLGARVTLATNWIRMLSPFSSGEKRSFALKMRIHAMAWMGRYLPGKVTPYIVRALGNKDLGVTKRHAILTSLVEGFAQLFVSVVLALATLFLLPEVREELRFPLLTGGLIITGLGILTSRPVLAWLLGLAGRIRGIPVVLKEDIPSARSNAYTLAVFIFLAAVNGGVLAICAQLHATVDAPVSPLIFYSGIAALTSAASVIIFFAPAGFGIAELTVVSSLVIFGLEAKEALSIALTLRLFSVVSDLLYSVLAIGLVRFSERKKLL